MPLWDWLMVPLSGAAHHALPDGVAWHARLMVLAWGVLLPLGALAARYFKVTAAQPWPQALDNPAWWHGHRVLQWGGAGLMTAGLGVILATEPGVGRGGAGGLSHWHTWVGWAVVVLGWGQIASGLARGSKGGPTDAAMRGDHYDMTPWRRGFERLHKGLGWLAVVGGVVAIGLGLRVADAPRWMPLVLLLWWSCLVVAAVRLQRRGRCIDTYQAIWGPDPVHPGNRRTPIGWGVRRPAVPPAPTSTLTSTSRTR